MKYFSHFPSLYYSLREDQSDFKQVKNIFVRLGFIKEILTNTNYYYDYTMRETDTPEIIAHKLYGDPNRYWVILMTNQIIDPNFQLPLEYGALEEYIAAKYSSLEYAKSNIHHYEKQVTTTTQYYSSISSNTITTIVTSSYYDDVTGTVQEYTMPTINTPIISLESTSTIIDGVTITKSTDLVAITNYDYEYQLNEDRRKIKLINAAYIDTIESNFKTLLKGR